MSLSGAPLEGRPTDGQKERLEDWLSELKLICHKYGFLLDTQDGDTRVIDLDRQTVVGMGLFYLVNGEMITAYEVESSILDGTWPVDTPSGPREQRFVGRVWPHRDQP